jgi:hypothetical protein
MKKAFLLFPLLVLFTFCRTPKTVVKTPPVPPVVDSKQDTLKPLAYFRFEPADIHLTDKNESFPSSVTNPKVHLSRPLQKRFQPGISPVGSCLSLKKEETVLWPKEIAPPPHVHQLTIEVALKFDPDSMNSFIMGFNSRQFVISPEMIKIETADTAQKIIVIPLDHEKLEGASEYIWDGKWHHFAFKFSGDTINGTGFLEIFIDGKSNQTLQEKIAVDFIETSAKFAFEFSGEQLSSKNCVDELAIYTSVFPNGIIVKHSNNFFAGQHYDNLFFKKDAALSAGVFPLSEEKFDPKDFAPGFPAYTVSQFDQLSSFPLPRYKTATTLHRNFPWFDPVYTAYDFSKTVSKKADGGVLTYPGMRGEEHAKMALALNIEMYSHWNYYFSIPTPTYSSREFADPKTIAGTQAAYANLHPEIQISTYLFWGGINPSAAGFGSTKPFVKSNANIDPCKKTYENIHKDGLTQRKNLEALIKVLPDRNANKKIDFINEDGEVFGESWTPNAEGYRGKPFISCIQKDSSTARKDRARWQYEVFAAYSGEFIANKEFPGLLNTKFSFYQVSAFLPKFYGDYSEVRKINSKFRGDYFSTPDFYPGHIGFEIWNSKGAYHGLDDIADGRKAEIALGDNYFSPFICAGWFNDAINFRPAEWLAATKALGMMGADFYYPAYFNIGNPADKKPQDPRGYIYQIAIPSYAQAITSRYEDIFLHSGNFTYVRNYNRILIYRRDTTFKERAKSRYAIFAGIFPNSNYENALPDSVTNNVNIAGDILKINFLRQGATYIYDKSDPGNIVFYQLDGWHEASHPYYWSKDFVFEAELHDDSNKILLRTERPRDAAAGDYTRFITYISFANSSPGKKQPVFHFEPRNDTGEYYIWVRARAISKPGPPAFIKFSLDGKNEFTITGINSPQFQWYCYTVSGKPSYLWASPGIQHELKIVSADASIELDKIILSRTKIPVGINTKEIAAGIIRE